MKEILIIHLFTCVMFVYDNDDRLTFVIEDVFLFFQSKLPSLQDHVCLLVWSLLKYMCRISKICCAKT